MRFTVVASGDLADGDERWLEGGTVIAADAGAASLDRLGRRPDRLVGDLDSIPDELLERLGAAGVVIDRHPADKDASDSELALEAAVAAGAPEIVVYNAGNNEFRSLLEMDVEFWERLWRLCCLGGFLVGREAARRMLPRGRGTLIFTGATASIRARPPFTAFASAKAALRALAHGMAREFGPQGLHVGHVIIDGGIDGDRLNERFPQWKQQRGADGMLDPDAIAAAYWQLHCQDRTAWTLELDLRPYKEPF